MMKLSTRESQEIQEEGMQRKRKPTVHMRKQNDPLTVPRSRLVFSSRRKATTLAGNQASVLVPQQHILRHDRREPLPRRHGLGGGGGTARVAASQGEAR